MAIVVFVLGIILFLLLIITHEMGHFLVAKRNGVKAEEFGIPSWGTADDVLANARICDSLTDAIADCVYAAGCTARLRDISLPLTACVR